MFVRILVSMNSLKENRAYGILYVVCMYLYTYVCMYVCIYVCMYFCLYVSMYECMFASFFLCILIYVSVVCIIVQRLALLHAFLCCFIAYLCSCLVTFDGCFVLAITSPTSFKRKYINFHVF